MSREGYTATQVSSVLQLHPPPEKDHGKSALGRSFDAIGGHLPETILRQDGPIARNDVPVHRFVQETLRGRTPPLRGGGSRCVGLAAAMSVGQPQSLRGREGGWPAYVNKADPCSDMSTERQSVPCD